MLRKVLLLVAFALFVPALVVAAPLPSITDIYVFGDSLSDDGNAYLRTGGLFPPPPYDQRFSNGPVAVERLAANVGVPLTPSLAGGTDYAMGGAATGPVPIPPSYSATSDNYITVGYPPVAPFFANTGIEVQVSAFVTAPPAFSPATSLFVVWGGANDFFINPSATTASAAVTNLSGELMQLYGVGARNFLVPNMVDLSLTPYGLSLTPSEQFALNQLSLGFNAGLGSTLDMLALLPGINIIEFDTFSFFNEMIANPAAFGFTNVTSACFSGLAVCDDPNSYLFWDTAHPTTAASSLLGDRFTTAVVPEPSTLLLLASGLAGLGAMVWQRRRG